MASQCDNDWQSTKKTALERNTYVFNNSLMSDITFTCGESKGKYFHVHKYVLATSSVVFESMFYGKLAEKASVIHLPDTDEVSLQEFFRFLYTDNCTITPKNVRVLMYLGRKYIVPSLMERCVDALHECMRPDKVLELLEEAIYFNEKELKKKCWEVIDVQTSDVVSSDAFCDISQATLINLLKRDTLHIAEVDLFKAVLKWSESQCSKNSVQATGRNKRAVLNNAVYEIRFLLMSQKEFTQYVSSSGLLTAEKIVQIYCEFNNDSSRIPVRRRGKQVVYQSRVQRLTSFVKFFIPLDLMLYIKSWVLIAYHLIAHFSLTSLIYLKSVCFANANYRLFRLLIFAAVIAGLHLVLFNVYTFAMVLCSSFIAVVFISIYLFFGDDELYTTLIDSATFTILMMIVSLSPVMMFGGRMY